MYWFFTKSVTVYAPLETSSFLSLGMLVTFHLVFQVVPSFFSAAVSLFLNAAVTFAAAFAPVSLPRPGSCQRMCAGRFGLMPATSQSTYGLLNLKVTDRLPSETVGNSVT